MKNQWSFLDLGLDIINNKFGCKIWQVSSTNSLNFVLYFGFQIVDGTME
jgi:hypothetical protein